MSETSKLVSKLVEKGEDFEWYPTTTPMIEAVSRCIPDRTSSLLDIGAGDGRVLKELSKKCDSAQLYSVEKSEILNQAQPDTVIPLGTNLFEQNLACLPVDFIFCNPPYSEYEEWVCKIISEGYANRAFLVIPQRWKESKLIAEALKSRGATTRVIHSDDFQNAERQARAVVDVVEVSYPKAQYGDKPKDPFDIWFDQNIDTFDRAKETEKDEAGSDLKRRYANSNIAEMVAAYREEYELLEGNYRAIFKLDYSILKELGIDKNHVRDGLKKKMAGLKVKYWQILFDRLHAITSRLSTKSKETLVQKLTANTSVEFTASNAYAIVLWAVKNARQYFDAQLVDLFKALATFENVMKYKSNVSAWGKDQWRYSYRSDETRSATHYKLDYRIVVEKYAAIRTDTYDRWDYPGGLSRGCHELIADVIAVFSNLGFATSSTGSVNRAWESGTLHQWWESGTGGDILFEVRAYKKGTVHFRFKPAAIMALNIEAGRLLKWVRSAEEVVQEMGYTKKEAEKYFNSNAAMLASGAKLLGAFAGGK